MSKKTKKILTGHVARIIGGVLVTAGPGDVAPDWVTNPDLIADAGAEEESTPDPAGGTHAGGDGNTPPAGDVGTPTAGDDSKTPEGDNLDVKKAEELKAIAEELGLAKSGSKPDLIARIRAKRAENEPASDTGDTAREALVEKAKALGVDDAEDRTDAELLTVVGQED